MGTPSIKSQLSADIKTAMKAGDKVRLSTLRNIHAAIKQREVDERVELDDAAVLAVLDKRAKQHRESLDAYHAAGRSELAAQEQAELDILAEYLPAPLEPAELDRLIDAAVAEAQAETVRDMGRVMAILKPQVQGRADMSAVSARVKARLDA